MVRFTGLVGHRTNPVAYRLGMDGSTGDETRKGILSDPGSTPGISTGDASPIAP